MDRKTQARFQARAKVLKAISHPTRLFLVDELSRGEQCVCELTELVGAEDERLTALQAIEHDVDRRKS